METGLTGLNEPAHITNDEEARAALAKPTPDRLLVAAQGLRLGITVEEICAITRYDPWFVRQLEGIVALEASIPKKKGAGAFALCEEHLAALKRHGFSDARIAELSGVKPADV